MADVRLGCADRVTLHRGERCRCSCHPHLPDSDRHDYGFDCVCTAPAHSDAIHFHGALDEIREVWQSPGEQIRAAKTQLRPNSRPG